MLLAHARRAARPLPALAAICVALVPTVAWADAGIPMLFLVWPGAWMVLVPVVLVEALFARKLLRLSVGRSLKVAFVANLVSTGVGIPITWLGLLLLELPAGILGAAFESHPYVQVALFPFTVAWLGPVEQLWIVVVAAIILCIPFYFASIWIEYLIARRLLPDLEEGRVRKWSRIANGASYGFIVFGLFGYLLYLRWHGPFVTP
jgi:hypothetical protein